MTKGAVRLLAVLLTPLWLSVGAFQEQRPSAVLTGTLLSDDGLPVNGAIVSIVGTDKPGVRATVTNVAGEFSFVYPRMPVYSAECPESAHRPACPE